MNEQFEKALAEFERQWQTSQPPALVQSLDESNVDRDGVIELLLVDLEFRWHCSSQGRTFDDALGGQPRLDDYERILPACPSFPEFAVAEEYRIRRIWGDRPNHDHFVARFPHHGMRLVRLLRDVDRELLADDSSEWAESAGWKPTPRDSRAPLPFSDFVLEEHLGTGGMGKVYRARQISLDRKVAVKALLKSRHESPAAVERFLQEGRLLARLRHPNIVGVHGLGRFPGGGYFLVMDFVEGNDLATLLDSSDVSIARAIEITIEVANAIHYAHQQDVIHCDLKPSNVLVANDGDVFVADFGFAQLLKMEQASASGGTLAYMAPEQADPTLGAIGIATDVYGIGGILYHMLTGKPPLPLDDSNDDPFCSEEPPQPPHEISPTISKTISDVCMKCLSKNPHNRFASAAEIAPALAKSIDAPRTGG